MKRFHCNLVTLFMTMAVTATAAEKDPIKVGALFNLVGGMSSIDVPALHGAQLYAKQINDAGGILNGRKLELIIQDTKTDQKSFRNWCKKNIERGCCCRYRT